MRSQREFNQVVGKRITILKKGYYANLVNLRDVYDNLKSKYEELREEVVLSEIGEVVKESFRELEGHTEVMQQNSISEPQINSIIANLAYIQSELFFIEREKKKLEEDSES